MSKLHKLYQYDIKMTSKRRRANIKKMTLNKSAAYKSQQEFKAS